MKVQKVEYGPDDGMNPQGSSLMGYVTATFDSLVELLGEPNCPPGDKVWNSWDLCFTVYDKDGEDFENVYASIYDWKEMHPFASTSGEYRWHIGGFRDKEYRADWLVSDLVGQTDANEYTFMRKQ